MSFVANLKRQKNYILRQSSFLSEQSLVENSNLGLYTCIQQDVFINHCKIGNCSQVDKNTKIINAHIGKFVKISSNVKINPHINTAFDTNFANSSDNDFSFYEINQSNRIFIGNDVWIGKHVIIMPKVNIGSGAVIKDNSIIACDIPPYAIVSGFATTNSPKYRFDKKTIKALMKLAWWNWSVDKIANNFDYFDNIDNFKDRYLKKFIEL